MTTDRERQSRPLTCYDLMANVDGIPFYQYPAAIIVSLVLVIKERAESIGRIRNGADDYRREASKPQE